MTGKSTSSPSNVSHATHEEVEEEQVYHVVDKWDSGQVKSILDESAKQILLDRFKYEESNLLVDFRLFLCALPVVAAFYALIYDFLHPFPESASVLKLCVEAYIVLMVILSIYSTFVECNTIMIGYKKPRGKGKGAKSMKIRLISKMKRFDDIYTLIIESPNSKKECKKSVGSYFDVNGVFVEKNFEKDVLNLHKGVKIN